MVYILGKSGMHSKWVGNAIVSVMPLEHTKRNRAAKNTQSDRIQFDPFAGWFQQVAKGHLGWRMKWFYFPKVLFARGAKWNEVGSLFDSGNLERASTKKESRLHFVCISTCVSVSESWVAKKFVLCFGFMGTCRESLKWSIGQLMVWEVMVD